MYVNYYDCTEKREGENNTIGILLCTDKNNTMVEFALPEKNATILASQYQLYLPKKEEITNAISQVLENEQEKLE